METITPYPFFRVVNQDTIGHEPTIARFRGDTFFAQLKLVLPFSNGFSHQNQ